MKYITYTKKDWQWVNMKESEIKSFPKIAANSIKEKLKTFQSIKKENRTFENTVLAYENANDEESLVFHKISTLGMVSDKKNIRDTVSLAEVEFSNLCVDISYDIKNYKAFKDYYECNYILEKKEGKLDEQGIKLVEDVMRGFRRMGFDLPKEKQSRIKKIEKEISKLSNGYDKRLAENTDHILCDEGEMSGIPQNIKNSFTKIKIENKKTKEVKDVYKVTLEYPEYGPYIKYADNRKKREEIYKLFLNQGGKRNVEILEKLIMLRTEKAKILNYANHGDYVTENRMAKNSKNVYSMINAMLKALEKNKNADFRELINKGKELGIKDFKLSDSEYITNKILEEKYAFDQQEVRQYFPLDHVMSSMFDLFGNLFGFEVRESDIKLWHKDAVLYEIYNKSKKLETPIAYICMDLFPREGKFGHACMMPIVEGIEIKEEKKEEGLYRAPVVAIICNFSKPQKAMKATKNNTATKVTPSLLTLGEVETLYHEFGHSLHATLTKAKHNSHAGTNVVWDFVEVPSQLLEEWVSEEKVLNKISKHHITGKPLPKSIINKIKNLKKFMQAKQYMTQAMQTLLDTDLYTGKNTNSVKHYQDLMKKYVYTQSEDVLFVSRFGHLANHYSAGYYSYMWAENISKDIYSIFKNKNIFDKKLGEKYRKEILEQGSSRDETASAEVFLGRKINQKALADSLLQM